MCISITLVEGNHVNQSVHPSVDIFPETNAFHQACIQVCRAGFGFRPPCPLSLTARTPRAELLAAMASGEERTGPQGERLRRAKRDELQDNTCVFYWSTSQKAFISTTVAERPEAEAERVNLHGKKKASFSNVYLAVGDSGAVAANGANTTVAVVGDMDVDDDECTTYASAVATWLRALSEKNTMRKVHWRTSWLRNFIERWAPRSRFEMR